MAATVSLMFLLDGEEIKVGEIIVNDDYTLAGSIWSEPVPALAAVLSTQGLGYLEVRLIPAVKGNS